MTHRPVVGREQLDFPAYVSLHPSSAGGGGRGVRAKRAHSKCRSVSWTVARSCLSQTIDLWGRVRKAKGLPTPALPLAPPPPPHCTTGERSYFPTTGVADSFHLHCVALEFQILPAGVVFLVNAPATRRRKCGRQARECHASTRPV